MAKVKLVLIDLDGVIYRGDIFIDGASFFVNFLREKGLDYLFITNSTLRPRRFYAEKLRANGIYAREDHIITAAYATACYIKLKGPSSPKIFMLGEEGLKEELMAVNPVFLSSDDSKADYVVVALDREINYEKICLAYDYIISGAELIAVNKDLLWPVENGLKPGVGFFVVAFEAVSGRKAYVIGKPNIFMLDLALKGRDISKDEVLVVGDKLDSDILMANKAGVKSALVLTGVTSASEAYSAEGDLRPTYVVRNLYELANIIL